MAVPGLSTVSNNSKLYVCNLNSCTAKSDIEEVFRQYGPLRNVWVSCKSQNQVFAFVEYENPSHAELAANLLDGVHILGSRIRVEYCNEQHASTFGISTPYSGYDMTTSQMSQLHLIPDGPLNVPHESTRFHGYQTGPYQIPTQGSHMVPVPSYPPSDNTPGISSRLPYQMHGTSLGDQSNYYGHSSIATNRSITREPQRSRSRSLERRGNMNSPRQQAYDKGRSLKRRGSRDRARERRYSRGYSQERRRSRDRSEERRRSRDRSRGRKRSRDGSRDRKYRRDCSRDRVSNIDHSEKRRNSRDCPRDRRSSRDRSLEQKTGIERFQKRKIVVDYSRDRKKSQDCSNETYTYKNRSRDHHGRTEHVASNSSSSKNYYKDSNARSEGHRGDETRFDSKKVSSFVERYKEDPRATKPSCKRLRRQKTEVADRKKPLKSANIRPPGSAEIIPSSLESESSSSTLLERFRRKTDLIYQDSSADKNLDDLKCDEKWVRSAPDELYYKRTQDGELIGTERCKLLCEKFQINLVKKAEEARLEAEELGRKKMEELQKEEDSTDSIKCGGTVGSSSGTDSSDSSGSDSENSIDMMSRSDSANKELEKRKKHPRRLHEELWHNEPGMMNDGPVCRCSAKARRFGIRHGFYPGEKRIPMCDLFSNNANKLYHYRITITPAINFLVNTPTVINHDGHEYIFEGFSLLSHSPVDLTNPPCRVIRFNIRYDVSVDDEKFPESFCVKELMLLEQYVFREILELVDFKYDWLEDENCPPFHLFPRFVRLLPDNGKEILSISRILIHLLRHDKELVKEEELEKLYTIKQTEWQDFADQHKGTIVSKWGMKPSSIRVDQIDRDVETTELQDEDGIPFPLIVHFGIRPPQLSYAGNANYQRAWRRYVKYRHLLSNMPKPSAEDKLKLLRKEIRLQQMRTAAAMKRDVTVAVSSKGFRTTGICCDLVQHAMLIPVLLSHLRFHKSLSKLESTIEYRFSNRYLLQLAMTHPSYRENFGTNPDHARNALTNCGIRQPEYGDRRIHYASTRKRGINTLINIMARFGKDEETESEITHNERLEFLGDAVVEFVTSIHLFHMFPDLEEGGLATYRAAIVQNQHLAVLAKSLDLDQYMLYAHGSDLCHDSELRHAMANCFEALMGALFLDGGIETADKVFGKTLFLKDEDDNLLDVWMNYPPHPLQAEEDNGDRHWIKSHAVLQKLAEFEERIGVEFKHIRLLARAFTDRSLGYNNLSRGSNQRLEFLGDTVLQLISSEYLYRHFPDHHEGHLSLLRSSLVNNRTQAVVCDDLGMPEYAMRGDPKAEMKTKDRADLLEAFLGALYIDKKLEHCIVFCSVCFFPRLNDSIVKQEWNDPKSKLQQCCLTLRAMNGKEPDIPHYRVTDSLGPTNTRIYAVAVYFRGQRLACARGSSIQDAEMKAAEKALEEAAHLFPQLNHQKKIINKTNKKRE